MRIRCLLFAVFTFTSLVYSQNYHDTQGGIEVSNTGQATFTLPIALPPSIQSVGPTINLVYASGQQGGVAGQGWNISGVSVISRISTRKNIDGFIDGVDFDSNDKLALDGQRLILKTGTYLGDGSTYETEIQSNLKIELTGSGTSTMIVVTSPDGSKKWYGTPGAGSGVVGNDLDSFFYIKKFQDVSGNVIEYRYVAYGIAGSYPKLYIDEILFSYNTISNPTFLNKIKFNYVPSTRIEKNYVKGINWEKSYILDKIEVFTNNLLFKRYQLTHPSDEYGYERVTKIQEFNSIGEAANPIDLQYDTTGNNVFQTLEFFNSGNQAQNFNDVVLHADFNGDSKNDYISNTHFRSLAYYNSATGVSNPVYSTALPFTASKRKTFAINTIRNNKLNQKPSILNIVNTQTTLKFDLYDINNTSNNNVSIINFSSKTIPFDNTTTYNPTLNTNTNISGFCSDNCSDNCQTFPTIKENDYLIGDYNGDGISEILFFSQKNEKYYTEIKNYSMQPLYSLTSCNIKKTGDGVEAFLISLNPNLPATEGTEGYVKLTNLNFQADGDKKYVQDFNGDGKDDILIIKPNNSYQVITFNQLTVAPWVTTEVIGQGTFYFSFYADYPILFGDFNGDGKTDMMHPNVVGDGCEDEWYCNIWYTYYSNPKTNNGDFFEIVSQSITPYMPSRSYDIHHYRNSYHAMDINKDGKSDLVRLENEYTYFPQNNYSDLRIHTFTQSNSGVFYNNILTPWYQVGHDLGFQVMSPINTNDSVRGVSQDLTLLSYYNQNGSVFAYQVMFVNFEKNFNKDNRLTKVTQSGGANVTEISYKEMISNAVSFTDDTTGIMTDFYSSNNSFTYPYVEIKKFPNYMLVSELKNTSLGIVKYQAFKYNGFSVDYSGLGFIGFKKTARTNWYLPNGKKLWSVTDTEPLNRGRIVRTYSQLLEGSTNFAFTNLSINPSNVTGLLSKVEYQYYPIFQSPLGVFTMLLQNEKTTDYLTNVIKEKTTSYTTEGYNLPNLIVQKNYLGTVEQGKVTTLINFVSSNTSGTGLYHLGRPWEVFTTSEAYGDIKTSYERLTYSPSNGNVITKEKKVGTDVASIANATETLVETFAYFPNGNLQSKTLSEVGFPVTTPPIGTRTTSYTYDSTNRFVKTTTDVDGVVSTNNTYDSIYGVVLSQTNNTLGQTTTCVYDKWGKRTKVTDFLGKYVDYIYTKFNGNFITLQNGQDGSSTEVITDLFGKVIRKGEKNINGFWSYVSYTYDNYGRKTIETDPYFTGESPAYTTYSYDDFNRPILISSKGVTTSINYDGLSASSNDGLTTKTATKNANGHLVSNQDSLSGTIEYTYNALGNLLTTKYDGVVNSTIQYDLWGRKVSFNDISLGIYSYEYNAFSDLLKETTPNGFTEYTYTPTGKILTKWIKDATTPINTNIKSTYNYSSTYKWLTSIAVLNPIDGNSNYAYIYDVGTSTGYTNTKQLKKVDEVTPQATFSKELTFDSFGRVLTEKLTAFAQGKTATKTTNNTYVNGKLYQKFDGTTATGTPLWKANTVNARGQYTSISLGNTINVNNTYHNYGLLTSSVQSNSQTNITLNNTYDTTPIMLTPGDFFGIGATYTVPTGNLLNKNNSITSNGDFFTLNEDYKYDNFDRLVQTKSNDLLLVNEYTFNSSDEGFQAYTSIVPPPALGSGYATQIVNNGKLEVSLYGTAGTRKTIYQGIQQGKSIKIQAEINVIVGNGNCLMGGSPTISFAIKEIDSATQQELVSSILPTSGEYTVLNSNVDVVLEINSTSFLCGDFIVFSVDNVKIFEQKVENQSYDNRGRITQNNLGNYNYTKVDKPYQNTSVALTLDGISYYESRARLSVSYNAFKSPVEIDETGKERLTFGYNAMEKRSVMYYGDYTTDKLLRPFRKYYSTDGNIEIKYTLANGTTPEKVEFFFYIGGDGYSAPILSRQENTATPSYFYLHRDYQGSILAITNNVGVVVEKRQFDVWGNILKVEDGAGNVLPKMTFLDRGYTGHEHLQGVVLINMNARLYDPVVHRFLQADNVIADPNNPQNYNRYSYALNNPTKYIDIDGNTPIIAIGIGIVVAVAAYITHAAITGTHITWYGVFSAAVMGFISSTATFGVGSGVATISNFAVKTVVQTVSHGFVNGSLSWIQGGKFWNGFATGSVSSLGALAWSGGGSSWNGVGGKFGGTTAGTLAFGSISGGAASALTGGNFWTGAVTGLVVSGLNHVLHDHPNRELISKLKKEIKSLGAMTGDNESRLKKILALDTFKKLQARSGGKVDVRYVYTESGLSSNGDEAYYTTQRNANGEKYTGSDGGYINVFPASFWDGWSGLANNLVHEFGHAISRYTGHFASNFISNKKNWTVAIALDEVFAYDFQSFYGFSKFPLTTGFLDSLEILSNNKITINEK